MLGYASAPFRKGWLVLGAGSVQAIAKVELGGASDKTLCFVDVCDARQLNDDFVATASLQQGLSNSEGVYTSVDDVNDPFDLLVGNVRLIRSVD